MVTVTNSQTAWGSVEQCF